MPITDTSEHRTKRIFLVGNGPSLAYTDLSLLIPEISWGMAEIQLIYPSTKWRPSRVWWNDHPQDVRHIESILYHVAQGYPCWIRKDVVDILTGEYDVRDRLGRSWGSEAYSAGLLPYAGDLSHVHGWDFCRQHNAGFIRFLDEDGEVRPDDRHSEGWHDIENGLLCKYGSGLNCMLQQAVIEGYNPIYLLGCDLGFKGVALTGADDPDHFSPDYNRRVREGYRALMDNETHIDFHTHARDWTEANGFKIYNATPGGELEVYERVDYESLFTV